VQGVSGFEVVFKEYLSKISRLRKVGKKVDADRTGTGMHEFLTSKIVNHLRRPQLPLPLSIDNSVANSLKTPFQEYLYTLHQHEH